MFDPLFNRRRFLHAGMTSVLGLSLPQLLAAQGHSAARSGRAKNVLVILLNWDHHDYMYTAGSCGTVPNAAGGEGRYGIGHWVMMGSTDQAYAALLEDLDVRGLLDETLVCFVTEFGRTPRLNRFQGRDHWTDAYSIVFAGAGVPGGQVIGRSDKDGGYIADQPHTPEDYAATIYEKLGRDRQRPLYTSNRRPVCVGHGGQPIRELF